MNREQFIENTIRYITVSNGLPIRVTSEEISERIDDSLAHFYRTYNKASQRKYFLIEKKWFREKDFLNTRTIKLPDCVLWVEECVFTSGPAKISLGVDNDLTLNKMIAADVFLGTYASDDIVNRLVYTAYYDLSRAFIRDRVRYDYNEYTHDLVLYGGTPPFDVSLLTFSKVPENALFDDPYFRDYVRGACLEQIGNMTGLFSNNLLGGVTFDSSSLISRGKEMMAKVEERIKEEQVGNYITFFHG